MAHLVLPLLVALSYSCPPHIDLHAQSKDPLSCLKNNSSCIIIAESHAGDDPHGDDPHGADPHDENHDPGLPANKYNSENKAPQDPYGDAYPNTHQPYTP